MLSTAKLMASVGPLAATIFSSNVVLAMIALSIGTKHARQA